MVIPPFLEPQSVVQVLTPASPVKANLLRRGMDVLSTRGWCVRPPQHGESTWYFCAGDDATRASQLIQALEDPEVDAIWFARGGYGSGRLLRLLDAVELRPPKPKWVIGCSDVTFLLHYLQQRFGWVVVHGPMVAGDLASGRAEEQIFRLLEGDWSVAWAGHKAVCTVLRGGGEVRARLTGGCLSILAAGMGTAHEVQSEDTILFMEDVHTRPYQLDRMLVQLDLAGKLDRVRGIVFGEMPGCVQHANQGYELSEALMLSLARHPMPVIMGFPSGHTRKPSLPLLLGATYLLDPEAGMLRLEESCP